MKPRPRVFWWPCPTCGDDNTHRLPVVLGGACGLCGDRIGWLGGRLAAVRGRPGRRWACPRYVRTWRRP